MNNLTTSLCKNNFLSVEGSHKIFEDKNESEKFKEILSHINTETHGQMLMGNNESGNKDSRNSDSGNKNTKDRKSVTLSTPCVGISTYSDSSKEESKDKNKKNAAQIISNNNNSYKNSDYSKQQNNEEYDSPRDQKRQSNQQLIANQPIANTTYANSNNAVLAIPVGELKKLVRILRSSSLSKRSKVLLSLDLGEQGEVRLNVTLKGKSIHIDAQVENRVAAGMLTSALMSLKQDLHQIDLLLEEFNICIGFGFSKPANKKTVSSNEATIEARLQR
jgi:hypothetical protein